MKIASFSKRIKALFIDYLLIVLYLLLLFGLALGIHFSVFNGIPEFSELQSQLIALFTSVLPVAFFHILLEYSVGSASLGKIRCGLKVYYVGSRLKGSILRNLVKFLPWQAAHMAVIKGIYTGFDSFFVLFFYSLSIILPFLYILMVWLRKDHRHLGDILGSCSVVDEKSDLQ